MKYCPNCGKELPDDAAFCAGCGEKQHQNEEITLESATEAEAKVEAEGIAEIMVESGESEKAESVSVVKNESPDYIGKTCPFCKTEITEDDEVTICPACDIAHHKGCWDENGGCTTFGCSGKASGTIVCYNCGADLSADQMFCAKCGASRPIQESNEVSNTQLEQKQTNCSNCGSPISSDQKFCGKCGCKLTQQPIVSAETQNAFNAYNAAVTTKKAPKKGIVIGMVVAVIAIIAIIAGISTGNSNAQKIEDYKAKAKEFSTLCWNCGGNLEEVGNDIQTYWSNYIYSYRSTVYYSGHYMYSIDDAVSYALSDNSTTVSTIKIEWSNIKKLYDQLKEVPDTEVDEIWSDIKDAYDAIEEMYDCVINVSGNYATYKSNFGKCDTNLADALKALDNNLN